jgi:hypothetical protein
VFQDNDKESRFRVCNTVDPPDSAYARLVHNTPRKASELIEVRF